MPGSEEQGGRRGGQWERFEGLRCGVPASFCTLSRSRESQSVTATAQATAVLAGCSLLGEAAGEAVGRRCSPRSWGIA